MQLKNIEMRLILNENSLQLQINEITSFILWKYLYEWTCTSFSWSPMVKRPFKQRCCAIFVNFTMTLFLDFASFVSGGPENRELPPEFSQRIFPQRLMAVWFCFGLSSRSQSVARNSSGGPTDAGWRCPPERWSVTQVVFNPHTRTAHVP